MCEKDEFDKKRFRPLQCGGCQALGSARDYIRILEERNAKMAQCIKDFGVLVDKKEDSISWLEKRVVWLESQLGPQNQVDWKEEDDE